MLFTEVCGFIGKKALVAKAGQREGRRACLPGARIPHDAQRTIRKGESFRGSKNGSRASQGAIRRLNEHYGVQSRAGEGDVPDPPEKKPLIGPARNER